MCKLENVESDKKKRENEKKKKRNNDEIEARSFVDRNRSKSMTVRGYSRVAFHRDLINCQSLAMARSLSRQILYGAKLRENRVHGLARPKWYFISIRRWYFSMYVPLYRDTVIGDSIFGWVLELISPFV